MASTFVYCVRHGQTAENIQGVIQGQLDTQLDATGIEQAAGVAHSLKDITFDVALSSDLTRAVDTAEAILQHHPGVELCRTSLLRERHMGNLQGQPAFARGRGPPVDKTVEESSLFKARTLEFWDEMVVPHVKSAARVPSCMLVVSHGAFISTLARSLIGHRNIVKDPEVFISWCPNASVTLVEVQRDGTGILRSFGDGSHLAEPGMVENADPVAAL